MHIFAKLQCLCIISVVVYGDATINLIYMHLMSFEKRKKCPPASDQLWYIRAFYQKQSYQAEWTLNPNNDLTDDNYFSGLIQWVNLRGVNQRSESEEWISGVNCLIAANQSQKYSTSCCYRWERSLNRNQPIKTWHESGPLIDELFLAYSTSSWWSEQIN